MTGLDAKIAGQGHSNFGLRIDSVVVGTVLKFVGNDDGNVFRVALGGKLLRLRRHFQEELRSAVVATVPKSMESVACAASSSLSSPNRFTKTRRLEEEFSATALSSFATKSATFGSVERVNTMTCGLEPLRLCVV